MKKQILDACRKLGYEIRKVGDTNDAANYEKYFDAASIRKRNFYNIGAGKFVHPCWTNIDITDEHFQPGNDGGVTGILYDLFLHQPIPVATNSAELIYSSHTIEHIDDASLQNMLNESYRMLKPGGAIRLVTPDADNAFRAWKNNDRSYFFWIEWEEMNKNLEKQCITMPLQDASLTQIFLEDFAAAASVIAVEGNAIRLDDAAVHKLFQEKSFEDAMNYCTALCSVEQQRKYPFRHMNWFNEKKLRRMLTDAGFKTIYRSGFSQSAFPVLRNTHFFDKTLPQISLYMEAVK